MKHYKFDNEAKHQKKMTPKKQDAIDYFAMAMKQKKRERIHTPIVVVLIVVSLIGTSVGLYNLFKLGTTLAYFLHFY